MYEGKLPTGALTSQIVSNFNCLDLVGSISQLYDENKLNYSHYTDNLKVYKEMVYLKISRIEIRQIQFNMCVYVTFKETFK
jgi:hypothetical protein